MWIEYDFAQAESISAGSELAVHIVTMGLSGTLSLSSTFDGSSLKLIILVVVVVVLSLFLLRKVFLLGLRRSSASVIDQTKQFDQLFDRQTDLDEKLRTLEKTVEKILEEQRNLHEESALLGKRVEKLEQEIKQIRDQSGTGLSSQTDLSESSDRVSVGAESTIGVPVTNKLQEMTQLYLTKREDFETTYKPLRVDMANSEQAQVVDERIRPKATPEFAPSENGIFYLVEEGDRGYLFPIGVNSSIMPMIRACFTIKEVPRPEMKLVSIEREAICDKIDAERWKLATKGELTVAVVNT